MRWYTKKSISKKIQHQLSQSQDIAIIGMACRFPGAKDYHQFWENLKNGVNSIQEVPTERWDPEQHYSPDTEQHNKSVTKWMGLVSDIDKFDAKFFGISPREAELMDPQQRLLLELTWHCFEDAYYQPDDFRGKDVGVYIGSCNYDYKELLETKISRVEGQQITGVYATMLANRISHSFDFHGPSQTIDTACSSSLVAMHSACQAIRQEECGLAIAGGVSLLLTPTYFIAGSKAGMGSPRGQCSSFDAKADGYVRGEGAGLVLMKSLNSALADGDRIHGVIKGSAVNHGGHVRTAMTPNPYFQAKVVSKAWVQAGVAPNKIKYIEAHGTGTPLGDPLEIVGLNRAFKQLEKHSGIKSDTQHCGIGTAKTNIGHLESAAGIAGVIKVLLSMQKGYLPGLQNFTAINPKIKFGADNPLYLVKELQAWTRPYYAGVSSFGFGGTNAHLALAEGTSDSQETSKKCEKPYYLITLSAKSKESLAQKVIDLQQWLGLKNQPENSTSYHELLSAISYSANTTRSHFNHRISLVVDSTEALENTLQAILENTNKDNYFTGVVDNQKLDDAAIYKKVLKSSLQELVSADYQDIKTYRENLDSLANLYVKGYDLDWELLHQREAKQKISLPTYPFIQKRYWCENHLPPIREVKLEIRESALTDSGQPSYNPEKKIQLKKILLPHEVCDGWQNEKNSNLDDSNKHRSPADAMQTFSPGTSSDISTTNIECMDSGQSLMDKSQVITRLKALLQTHLYLDEQDLVSFTADEKFTDLGVDSIIAVELIRAINHQFNINIAVTRIYDYPTLNALAEYIGEQASKEQESAQGISVQDQERETASFRGASNTSSNKLNLIDLKSRDTSVVRDVDGISTKLLAPIAVRISRSGEIGDIELTEQSLIELSENQIKIHIKASSVIMPDLLCVSGLYPTLPAYPFTPGFEFAGEVIQVGEAVQVFKKGDRVFGVTGENLGGQSNTIAVEVNQIEIIPEKISFEQAVTLPEPFVTAYHALMVVAKLKQGERLFINSAASGTGLVAIQLAQQIGAEIYAVVGSDEKVIYLKSIGVQHVMNYRKDNFADFAKNEIGVSGVDVVLNMLTGELRQTSLNLVGANGRFVDLAVAGIKASASLNLSRLVDNQSFHSIDMRKIGKTKPEILKQYLKIAADQLLAETLKPLPINQTFSYNQVQLAYECVASRKGVGKVILSNDSSGLKSQSTVKSPSKVLSPTKQKKKDDNRFRASYSQERFYYVTQKTPLNLAYNNSFVFEIRGLVDIPRFKSAYCSLLNRHASLRASFDLLDDVLMKKINDNYLFELEVLETTEIDAVINVFIKKPFDLHLPPLIRGQLAIIDKSRCFLLLNIHHCVIDGKSLFILLEELFALYDGGNLPALNVQYQDFSQWQHDQLQTPASIVQQQFWLDKLKNFKPLELPLDFPRPAVQSFSGNTLKFKLDKQLTQRVKQFLSQQETTLYVFLLSIFYVALQQFAGQQDIIVGSPYMGRNEARFEQIVGVCINLLIMRQLLPANTQYLEFLIQVKKNVLEVLQHTDYPFMKLMEKLGIKESVDRSLMTDVTFNFVNFAKPALSLKDLEIKLYPIPHLTAKRDLSLEGFEENGEVLLELEYDSALFKAETIQYFISQYNLAIEKVLENPLIDLNDILSVKKQNIKNNKKLERNKNNATIQ